MTTVADLELQGSPEQSAIGEIAAWGRRYLRQHPLMSLDTRTAGHADVKAGFTLRFSRSASTHNRTMIIATAMADRWLPFGRG